MDYEKAYKEALERAKTSLSYPDMPGFMRVDVIFPELVESEDERIRKAIMSRFQERIRLSEEEFPVYTQEEVAEDRLFVAWLEKQKERGPLTKEEEYILHRIIEYLEDETCPSEWISLLHDIYCLPYEKQKEQKPMDKCDGCNNAKGCVTCVDGSEWAHYAEAKQKPAEWSEEDERMLSRCVKSIKSSKQFADSDTFKEAKDNEINWLENRCKSLRPQPHKQIYQSAKHDLAIKFMNYLDENRPEGKMSLSNGECEDIDKAFKENDWAKIMRYVEKYLPSWKPSEEQMDRLFSIVAALRKDYCDDMADFLASLCKQLKKLM